MYQQLSELTLQEVNCNQYWYISSGFKVEKGGKSRISLIPAYMELLVKTFISPSVNKLFTDLVRVFFPSVWNVKPS